MPVFVETTAQGPASGWYRLGHSHSRIHSQTRCGCLVTVSLRLRRKCYQKLFGKIRAHHANSADFDFTNELQWFLCHGFQAGSLCCSLASLWRVVDQPSYVSCLPVRLRMMVKGAFFFCVCISESVWECVIRVCLQSFCFEEPSELFLMRFI